MLKRDFANTHDNFATMDRNSIQFNSIEWLTMVSPRYREFSLWRNGHAPLPWYGSYIHNGWPVRSSSSSERSFKSSLCTSIFLTILETSSQLDCNCAFLSSSWRKIRPIYTLDEDKDTQSLPLIAFLNTLSMSLILDIECSDIMSSRITRGAK